MLVGFLKLLFKPGSFILSSGFLDGSVQGGFCGMVLLLFGLVSFLNELPGVHGDPGLFGFGWFCGGGLFGGMFHCCGEGCPFLVNVFLWVGGSLCDLWRW